MRQAGDGVHADVVAIVSIRSLLILTSGSMRADRRRF